MEEARHPLATTSPVQYEALKILGFVLRRVLGDERNHIRHLPPEVLIHLFKTVHDVTYDLKSVERSISSQPPNLILSHVCSFWRAIILSNPLLWTRIVQVNPWNIAVLRAYLERSHPHSIDVELIMHTPEWIHRLLTRGTMQEFTDLLCDNIERCRHLSLRVSRRSKPVMDSMLALLSQRSLQFPLLQELHLEITPDDFRYPTWQILDRPSNISFRNAPRFSTLMLGASIPLTSFADNITSLHLQAASTTIEDFHNAMIECKSLETLVLYGHFKNGIQDRQQTLVFPSLRFLSLFSFSRVSLFLRYISAPRLHHFSIAPYRHLTSGLDYTDLFHNHYPSYQFSDMMALRHHAPALRQLTLMYFSPKPRRIRRTDPRYAIEYKNIIHDLRSLATSLPNLETVSVLDNVWGDNFINVLLELGDDGRPIWPRLSAVAMNSSSFRIFKALRKIVTMRDRAGFPLSTIYIPRLPLRAKWDLKFLRACGSLQVVERDLWDEMTRAGMYYPIRDSLIPLSSWQ